MAQDGPPVVVNPNEIEIDTCNPALATCQSEMVETGPSLTYGGGCDTIPCTSPCPARSSDTLSPVSGLRCSTE